MLVLLGGATAQRAAAIAERGSRSPASRSPPTPTSTAEAAGRMKAQVETQMAQIQARLVETRNRARADAIRRQAGGGEDGPLAGGRERRSRGAKQSLMLGGAAAEGGRRAWPQSAGMAEVATADARSLAAEYVEATRQQVGQLAKPPVRPMHIDAITFGCHHIDAITLMPSRNQASTNCSVVCR